MKRGERKEEKGKMKRGERKREMGFIEELFRGVFIFCTV